MPTVAAKARAKCAGLAPATCAIAVTSEIVGQAVLDVVAQAAQRAMGQPLAGGARRQPRGRSGTASRARRARPASRDPRAAGGPAYPRTARATAAPAAARAADRGTPLPRARSMRAPVSWATASTCDFGIDTARTCAADSPMNSQDVSGGVNSIAPGDTASQRGGRLKPTRSNGAVSSSRFSAYSGTGASTTCPAGGETLIRCTGPAGMTRVSCGTLRMACVAAARRPWRYHSGALEVRTWRHGAAIARSLARYPVRVLQGVPPTRLVRLYLD